MFLIILLQALWMWACDLIPYVNPCPLFRGRTVTLKDYDNGSNSNVRNVLPSSGER